MISITAITFAVNILTSLLKRWVYPKYGKIGVQASAFLLASLGAVYVTYSGEVAGLQEFVMNALALFTVTVTMYEVVFSKISWFKVNTYDVKNARELDRSFEAR